MRYITSREKLERAVGERVDSLSHDGRHQLIEVTRAYTDYHYDQLPVDVKTLVSPEGFHERVKTAVDGVGDEPIVGDELVELSR